MDRDELKEIITKRVSERFVYNGVMSHYPPDVVVGFILSLIAPELEKARMWDRVKEMIDPSQLRTLAAWIDIKYPNDQNPQVQNDLRKWADALEGKEKG